MSDRSWVGGSTYKNALKGLNEEIATLARLTDELSKPEVKNGDRHRLKAEIMASLLRQKQYLDALRDIGQAAKQERKER